ncbi:MAG TPA: enoyl-CoA hydratase-related protein [Mycobacterium sp.]|jgi:enoyl-CoA hydratase/carnithine racemase|nr:enoyl-CoA hydratase-related protein [Mycobacterium sp.]
MNTSRVLLVEHGADGILQLTLNRPAELNAWTYELETSFFAALDFAAADASVRAIIVTGAGRGFCAGASMSLLGDVPDSRPDRSLRRRLCELAGYPKPLIAAINGAAAGIGFALAISCDLRFCAETSVLTTSFSKLGLVAEHGVAWILPQLVGRAHALDLLLSGRTVGGDEAEAMGLVNRSVPHGEAVLAARNYAANLIASAAPSSWATIKRQLLDANELTLFAAYEQAADLMESALAAADHREGVQAFRDKRRPQFAPLAQTAWRT